MTVALVVVALAATSCDLPRARANTRCRGNGLAQDGTYVLKCTKGRWKRGATIADTSRFLAMLLFSRLQAPPSLPPLGGDLSRVWIYGDSNTAPSHPGVPSVPTPTWAGLALPTANNRALDGRTFLTGPTPFLTGDINGDLATMGADFDTIIVAGGANDLFRKNVYGVPITIEQVEAALADARAAAVAAGKTVYVATFLPIRPALWFNDTTGWLAQRDIDAVNAWMLAQPGWNVIDVSSAVRDPATGYLAPSYNLGDGLHLSSAGHRAVANAVVGYFASHAILPTPEPAPPPGTTTTAPETTTTTEPPTTTTTTTTEPPTTTTTTEPEPTTTTTTTEPEPPTTTTTEPPPPG